MIATMMPKPIALDNGSGMMLISASEQGQDLFYDSADEYAEMSQTARYFCGGIIEHARALGQQSLLLPPTRTGGLCPATRLPCMWHGAPAIDLQ